jgi:hypothetical protein
MEYEDFRITEFRNQTYKCFRNGTVYKLMKTGWKQVGNTPKYNTRKTKYYYRIRTTIDGKTTEVKIHRLLAMLFLGLDIDDKTLVIDHIDGDSLNNDLTNLRVCTHRDNDRNKKNVKGVSYIKKSNIYQTGIMNNEGKYLQYSNKDHDAVLRWRQAKEIELGYLTRSIGIRT